MSYVQKSEILKTARKLLKAQEAETCHFVCHSIVDAVAAALFDRHQIAHIGRELRDWIQEDLLNGAVTLENWYARNYPELHASLSNDDVFIQEAHYKQIRLRWMTWMIKHWQSQGD